MPSRSLRRLAPLLAAALGLLVLVLVGAVVAQRAGGPARAASGIGGPFTMEDADGRPVTEASLAGHPTLVFFGYTHCPDVCPTTLDSISRALGAMGPAAKARALFVTLDPARDTPAVLKDYLSNFDPRIGGLTGTQEEVDRMARAYRVYAKKVPAGNGDYSVDHTGVVYLMDRDGAFVEAFNPDLDDPAAAAAALRAYL